MKYAYVHDRIFFVWGAEKVFQDLILKYPWDDAKIFTLFSDKKTFQTGEKTYEVVTSLPRWINRIFVFFSLHKIIFLSRLFDYRNLFVFYPVLCRLLSRKIDAYEPDQVVISSFAAVKNIRTHAPKILYLHSPNQYVRENYEEYIQKFSFPTKQLFQRATSYIRRADTTENIYSKIYVNSEYTNECAKKYYGIEGEVLYPKITSEAYTSAYIEQPHEYFIYVGRLVRFIREVDRIIELANALQLPLLVMGAGPDEAYLKSMAGPTITFVWHVADPVQRVEIMRHARWLINIAKESFGMVTAEALSLGVPVFGYARWGTQELVDEASWLLVPAKDKDTLLSYFEMFLSTPYDRASIQHSFRKKYAPMLAKW